MRRRIEEKKNAAKEEEEREENQRANALKKKKIEKNLKLGGLQSSWLFLLGSLLDKGGGEKMAIAKIIVDVLMQTDQPYSYRIPWGIWGMLEVGMQVLCDRW